jgi:predicted transposase YbfD/YdcC
MKNIIAFILFIGLISSGCQPGKSYKHIDNQKTNETHANKLLSLSDFTLKIPEGWIQEQSDNSMRIAQLTFTNNSEYKIAVFYFGQQDMVEANIERWKGQFIELIGNEEILVTTDTMYCIKLIGSFKKKNFGSIQKVVG